MPYPIVILNWNNYADSEECLNSVLPLLTQELQITLVDNGSSELVINQLKSYQKKNPRIDLVLHPSNLGFARAHNIEFANHLESENSYIFLFNNDTTIDETCIEHLILRIKKGGIGMLSCKMINYNDRENLDNVGHKLISSGEIIPIGHGEKIESYKDSFEHIGACAGGAVYSVDMLKDIGLFDEYFNTGYEDAELGLRAYIAGYKCIFEPKAIVYHKMGQSIKKIFDYNYTLKIQTNIYYTYLKLAHWQVIVINFIPWLLRFILITFINIIFWRPKYFKVQYHALFIIFFRDWKQVIKARRETRMLRRISWYKLLKKQDFFFKRDIQIFYKFIIKGEKSFFEKY